ncbi:MAG: DUF2442 domain-containing protein [SAR324 cluster bacterium]|nr:DUF2442 domain-containing protein [SAR324 cluster bacterium]
MTEVIEKIIDINAIQYISDYKLKFLFSDGKERIIDFKPFLDKSRHPDIRKYLDLNEFKNFSIVDGNLDWNDYELCFPVSDLYRGQI